MMKTLRAPAVPLVTHDPLFSVWSFADELNGDVTRHWDGVRQYMIGILNFDGVLYEFLGKANANDAQYVSFYEKMRQTACEIRPMTTTYRFECDVAELTLKFTSPLLLNDLDVLARPVTYVDYTVTAKDGKEHTAEVIFGFSSEFCVNDTTQKVWVGTTHYSMYFTSGTENMLKRAGDDHRIEWGSFHVVAPDYKQSVMSLRAFQRKLTVDYGNKLYPVNRMAPQSPNRELMGPTTYAEQDVQTVHPYYPTIVVSKELKLEGAPVSAELALAYDDVKAIQYFEENLDPYWKRNGDGFGAMLRKALKEKPAVLEKVAAFEEELLAKANKISPKYADIVSLAYRQTIAGHKLVEHDGEILFISKENFSNGCAATVDVTYPSIPLFLLYAPDLVEGMLNPIFKMIDNGLWDFEFAPHDAGRYPLVNGQIYGYKITTRTARMPIASQMPVEECGNMLLCVAALCFARKEFSYFEKHRTLLTRWADYLVKVGYNPENQLCTDDFAGRLAHNVNLSAKATCALGAFAKVLRCVGAAEEADRYEKVAHEHAAALEENALEGDHYRLTFDGEGTWSLKYNMVWDKLFDLHLFSQKVYDLELAWYKKQMKPYGISMDSRGDYTKSDWQMWTTRLFDDDEYTEMVINAMWDFLNESPDRVPFSDLYYVSKPYVREFQARTVQGGLFINLLNF